MTDEEKKIMERWAAGEITPDEAVELLAQLIEEEEHD